MEYQDQITGYNQANLGSILEAIGEVSSKVGFWQHHVLLIGYRSSERARSSGERQEFQRCSVVEQGQFLCDAVKESANSRAAIRVNIDRVYGLELDPETSNLSNLMAMILLPKIKHLVSNTRRSMVFFMNDNVHLNAQVCNELNIETLQLFQSVLLPTGSARNGHIRCPSTIYLLMEYHVRIFGDELVRESSSYA